MNFYRYFFLIILIPVSLLIVQVICVCVSELGSATGNNRFDTSMHAATNFIPFRFASSSSSYLFFSASFLSYAFRYSLLELKTQLCDLNVIKGQQTCSGNSRPGLDKYAATFQLPEVATSNTRSYRFLSSSLWNLSSHCLCSLLRV